MKKVKVFTIVIACVVLGLSNFLSNDLIAFDGGGSSSGVCIEICCGWNNVSEDCQNCFPEGTQHHCDLDGETHEEDCLARSCNVCNAEPRGCMGETPIQ